MGYIGMRNLLWGAAIIPPVALMIYIYRQDRIEREPPGLLLRLFAAGALSVVTALLLEMLGGAAVDQLVPRGSLPHAALTCFLVVGGAEEGGKFFFLRRITWKNPEFNYRFDAIVYAVFVSMGFALVENITYVVADGTMPTALLRGATAIPGHAAFAVFMGYYYGMAKMYAAAAARTPDGSLAEQYRFLADGFLKRAVWVPMLIHGFYDFCLEVQLPFANLVFLAFIIALDVYAFRRVCSSEMEDVLV